MQALNKRAGAHGRSAEAEHRAILAAVLLSPPRRQLFASDPFGYSAFAWHQWGTICEIAGINVNPEVFPTSRELKNPVLWLTHATALSEAATALIRTVPSWEHMPVDARGMCDSQFCGVVLMLVGLSLEVSLKAMLIMKKGVANYGEEETKYRHHRLEELADLLLSTSARDKAILKLLTHFTLWAGRYPDPGPKFEADMREIFEISERERIAAFDVFSLATRVMRHAKMVADEV